MSKKQQFTGLVLGVILVLLLASSATLYAGSDWDAKYWNNTTLSGDPVLHRTESELNHDWGHDSPHESVNKSDFSARWKRTINISAGTYRFTATMDDGMRVWVDDVLIIDSWYDSQEHSMSADVFLASGDHEVKVKYYDAGGEAVAKLQWVAVSGATGTIYGWRGEYYNNRTLSGSPVIVRDDQQIDFNWGFGSPDSFISSDSFSARWTRDIFFNSGRYRFTTTTDDGVRLWVNNQLIIDQWYDHTVASFSGEISLSGGTVPVKMEFYDRGELAEAHLTWTPVSTPSTPPPNTGGPNTAVVTANRLNVRPGPGLGYGLITTINRDTAVTLTQRNADASWVGVILPDGTQGWVSARYLNNGLTPFTSLPLWNGVPNNTPVPAPAPAPPPTTGNYTSTAAVINAYHLNVRSGPGITYNVIAVINRGQVVGLTGEKNANATWVKIILSNGTQGWVNAYYLG